MRQIHITSPDGAQAAYPNEQFLELRRQGAFADGTSYWHNGMPDWRPVHEYASGEVTSPAVPPEPLPAEIHVATPEGNQFTYPEELVRKLWREGQLPEKASYWREGMEDWQKLREWLGPHPSVVPGKPAVAPAPPPLPTTEPGALKFTHEPKMFTVMIFFLLLGHMVMTGVSMIVSSRVVRESGSPFLPRVVHQNNAMAMLQISALTTAIFVACAVFLCLWIYRANVNARGFGAQGLRFTPRWAVGWFFIPFANLAMPFMVMTEIWRTSKNPANWQAQRGTPLIAGWWATWLLSGILSYVAIIIRLMSSGSYQALVRSHHWSLAGQAFGLVATGLLLVIVMLIYYQQTTLVAGPWTRGMKAWLFETFCRS